MTVSTHGSVIVLPHAAYTIIRFPTQTHNPDTVLNSSCPMLIIHIRFDVARMVLGRKATIKKTNKHKLS